MISKRENIAEYILQTWQMEDLVRAFRNDEALEQNEYLHNLKNMMQEEGIMRKGHTQISLIAMQQMQELHEALYQSEAPYKATWLSLMPSINLFKAKTEDPRMGDIEACLTFLYEIMLLRLKKKEISEETLAVQKNVSKLLAFIAIQFRDEATAED